jgi:hypothetical protein
MKRRKFLKGATGFAGLTALGMGSLKSCAEAVDEYEPKDNPYQLFWGDLHCHCSISYAKGSLENAFEAAREQRLDFCSVVGHSSWHDTPRDEEHMNRIKDYIVIHDEGYEKLEELWPEIKKLTRDVRKPGEFIPFLAFEWHSTRYGDHNVYYLEPEGEIVKADSIGELREKMQHQEALIIPHHIGYLPGSRGIDWDHFEESSQSPFVEVFSFHGCSVSDVSPYPNLREMGPRSQEGLMETGLKKGHKFGIMASTDNHYGYPGSYGEGKIAVYAGELTQQSLWEAFTARRVYAVTGDRIAIDFRMNDALMGDEVEESGRREIEFSIQGEDFIDYVDLIKNCKLIKRFNPQVTVPVKDGGAIRAKVRFEWGWGVKNMYREWEGMLSVSDGIIRSVTPCFRDQRRASTSPIWQEKTDSKSYISRITGQDEVSCSFHSHSFGNPTPLTPINNSMVLDVEMPLNASIKASVNGKKFEHTLAELLEGQRSHLVGGYLDVAVSFHKAVPLNAFSLSDRYIDSEPDTPIDNYYLCVRQKNNQWAWTSPIWITS